MRFSGHSLLVIQAGTATSTRRRGEVNSYNIIRIDRPRVSIECLNWNNDRGEFTVAQIVEFRHSADGRLQINNNCVAAGS